MMNLKMDDSIQMRCMSLSNWVDSQMWSKFLIELEILIGEKLSTLDENDPIRRKANVEATDGPYTIAFHPKETMRTIFGEFKKTDVFFEIKLYRYKGFKYNLYEGFYNRLSITIPFSPKHKINLDLIEKIFYLMVKGLSPFYARCNIQYVLNFGCRYCYYPIRPECEIGLYWLTYLNKRYCDFWKEKITAIPHEKIKKLQSGILLKLSTSPSSVTMQDKTSIIKILGEKSFAMPRANLNFSLPLQHEESGLHKKVGEFCS